MLMGLISPRSPQGDLSLTSPLFSKFCVVS